MSGTVCLLVDLSVLLPLIGVLIQTKFHFNYIYSSSAFLYNRLCFPHFILLSIPFATSIRRIVLKGANPLRNSIIEDLLIRLSIISFRLKGLKTKKRTTIGDQIQVNFVIISIALKEQQGICLIFSSDMNSRHISKTRHAFRICYFAFL